MTWSQRTSPSYAKKRLALVLAGGIAGVAVGMAGVYGIGGLLRNADAACQPAVDLAAKAAPHARGGVAAVNLSRSPTRLPDLAFTDESGAARTLKDWRGRTVLLNLWATWCVPCREEMPALDKLQQTLGGANFQVVAVNIDTHNTDKPKDWLKQANVNTLAYFADPSAKIFQDLKSIGKAFGMPTTLLIDPQGCEIGNLAGPADWAGEDAMRLMKAVLGS